MGMKILGIGLMTAVIIAGASTVKVVSASMPQKARSMSNHPTNAAFRDGLYLGRLDARESRAAHLATGRWSRDLDRASFNAGYGVGYMQISGDSVVQ